MTRILLGLASCWDAFVAAPVASALLARGDELHVAWFGGRDDFEHARELGLPDLDATLAGAPEGDPLLAAHEFAADDWFGCETVLTVGHDPFAVALAEAAMQRDRFVVRLQGGERSGRAASDRHRRLADHAARAFCVRGETQRLRLCREGIADRAIAVVGSLPAAAAAAARAGGPGSDAAAPYLWLAVEHAATAAHGDALRRAVTAAAERRALRVLAVPTVLRAERWADPAWFVDAFGSPSGQLRAASAAALVVTDSLGHQELAAANGVPCVALPGAADAPPDVRLDLERDGALQVCRALEDLDDRVASALRAAPTGPVAAEHAVDRVVAALDAWRRAPERTTSLPSDGDASGRSFDEAERLLVDDVLHRGTLNSTRGTYVARFEREFAAWLGRKHAVACSSGSAAVHCAVAALGLSAGDEVITSPITDMGALTPILYEGCVPVFADVDPDTLNVTAATIEAQLTERTRAIVVTHLFGRPAELGPILELACRNGLPVIEDAAQAFGATLAGDKVGTQSLISAFSLQQGKHITTGEGGVVCTDDEALARRLFLCVNKAWGYGDERPDHYFPALNYRMTELQGAVACGQLPKLDPVVASRRMAAAWLRRGLAALPGIALPEDPPDGTHSYWKFAFRVDAAVVPGGAVALGGRMREQGLACAPRYVQKPAFECQLFRDWRAHPVSALPLDHNPRGATGGPLFDRRDYPGAVRGLEQVVVLPINERYGPSELDMVVDAIRHAHRELTS